jgi:hypothetical protein
MAIGMWAFAVVISGIAIVVGTLVLIALWRSHDSNRLLRISLVAATTAMAFAGFMNGIGAFLRLSGQP